MQWTMTTVGRKLIQAATEAQRMSDESGETYWIEVGITGMVACGKGNRKAIRRMVGHGDVESTEDNALIDTLWLVRAEIREDACPTR